MVSMIIARRVSLVKDRANEELKLIQAIKRIIINFFVIFVSFS